MQFPLVQTNFASNIYWVFGLLIKDSFEYDADAVIKRLSKLGIGCRPFFFPLHQQPVLRQLGLFKDESYPVAERLYRRGFYVPSVTLTDEQILSVSDSLKQVFLRRTSCMRPINFAVVINQQISIGGGYQQALNAALLTRNLSPNLVNLYFTTVR